jgi:hypothetical protein
VAILSRLQDLGQRRIITAGVFDRFPRLRLVAGHLGEALPFWLYRLDYMHAATPSEVTTQDELPIPDTDKRAFFQGIAERVFGL